MAARSPLPTPVTGIGPSGPEEERNRRRAAIAAVIVTALVAALIQVSVVTALGFFVYQLVTVEPGASPKMVAALRARVAKEYPGYSVGTVSSLVGKSDSAGGGLETDVYFTLKNIRHPGFVINVSYSAPATSAGDARIYENLDDFFRTPVAPSQPAESFIVMWLRSHPGLEPDYVYETADSTDATRTYEVMYTRSERTAGAVTAVQCSCLYDYVPRTDKWVDTTGSASSVPTESTRDDGSLVDTQSAVSQALPGFQAVGNAQGADGSTLLIVRLGKSSGLRMAVLPLFLSPPDPESDYKLKLFGAGGKKADAFAREWCARHPGTIVDSLVLDPDETGDVNVVDVRYVKSVAAVDDMSLEKDARLMYDAKAGTWSSSK